MGQDPEVIGYVEEYLYPISFGMVFFFLADTYRKFFVNVNQMGQSLYAMPIVVVLHLVGLYIFVVRLRLHIQ